MVSEAAGSIPAAPNNNKGGNMADAIGEKVIEAAKEAVGELLREHLGDMNRVFLENEDGIKAAIKLTFSMAAEGNMQVDATFSMSLGKVTADARKWAKEG